VYRGGGYGGNGVCGRNDLGSDDDDFGSSGGGGGVLKATRLRARLLCVY